MKGGYQMPRAVYWICQTLFWGLSLFAAAQLFGGLGVALLVTSLVAFAVWCVVRRVDTSAWTAEFHFGIPPPETLSPEVSLTREEEQQFDELVRHFNDD